MAILAEKKRGVSRECVTLALVSREAITESTELTRARLLSGYDEDRGAR